MKKKLLCVGNGSVGSISLDIIKNTKIYESIKVLKIKKNITEKDLKKKLQDIKKDNYKFAIIGFASLINQKNNQIIYDLLKSLKFRIINVVHHKAIVDKNVKIKNGVKIFPGVIINKKSILNSNVFINTGSIIDHDCLIKEHSQIGPGCRIAGNVKIGKRSFIGMGTIVKQGIIIGNDYSFARGTSRTYRWQ